MRVHTCLDAIDPAQDRVPDARLPFPGTGTERVATRPPPMPPRLSRFTDSFGRLLARRPAVRRFQKMVCEFARGVCFSLERRKGHLTLIPDPSRPLFPCRTSGISHRHPGQPHRQRRMYLAVSVQRARVVTALQRSDWCPLVARVHSRSTLLLLLLYSRYRS